MASRKQRQRARQRASRQAARQRVTEGVQTVHALLAEGNGRKALDLLKQLERERIELERLPVLFCAATMCRARNLEDKGMTTEAAAMRARSTRLRSEIRGASLTEEDLRVLVRALDSAESVRAYAEFLQAGARSASVERALADVLVTRRCWEGLDALDAQDPFRRDAERVRDVVDRMDAAEWREAANGLRDVGRRSAFAPWRAFCRAMADFGAGDDASLRRALPLIPDDFPLSGTVASWKAMLGDADASAPTAVQAALGLTGELRRELARSLEVSVLEEGSAPLIAADIGALAAALCPERPGEAVTALVRLAGIAENDGKLELSTLRSVVGQLLPRREAEATLLRVRFLDEYAPRSHLDSAGVAAYLRALETEYPDPDDRAMARAAILEWLARLAFQLRRDLFLDYQEHDRNLEAILGAPPSDLSWVSMELIEQSLRADPLNREGYLFASVLMRRGSRDRNRFESLMNRMASNFPTDPTPMLELAANYYQRNAYRKAEAVLAEAASRAPHDARVRDQQALGFLQSASMSARRGRYSSAATDIARAAATGRAVLAHILPAKRILLDLFAEEGDPVELVESGIAHLPLPDQLRVLVFLSKDVTEFAWSKSFSLSMAVGVEKALLARREEVVRLSAEERMALLRPLPDAFWILFDNLRTVDLLMRVYPNVLEGFGGDLLLEALEMLLSNDLFRQAWNAIDLALQGPLSSEHRDVLHFLASLIGLHEGVKAEPSLPRRLVEAADPATRQRMRALSQRIWRSFRGDLARALRSFDFDVLEPEDDELLPLPFHDEDPGLAFPGDEEDADGLDPDEADFAHFEMSMEIMARLGVEAVLQEVAECSDINAGTPFSDENVETHLGLLVALTGVNRWHDLSRKRRREEIRKVRAVPKISEYLDALAQATQHAGLRARLSPVMADLLFRKAGEGTRASRVREE